MADVEEVDVLDVIAAEGDHVEHDGEHAVQDGQQVIKVVNASLLCVGVDEVEEGHHEGKDQEQVDEEEVEKVLHHHLDGLDEEANGREKLEGVK